MPPSPVPLARRARPQHRTTAFVAGFALVVLGLLGPVMGDSGQPAPPSSGSGSSTSSSSPASSGASGTKQLLVLGDSVMQGVEAYGALPKLEQALPGWQISFDAAESRSTVVAPQLLQQHDPSKFDTVVMALGYNDGGDPAAFKQHATAALDLLKSVPHVFWLTLRQHGTYAQAYAGSNLVLASLPKSYPNLQILDWNKFSETLPASEFTVDGNHLDAKLAATMASFVADAVTGKSRYVSPAPTTSTPAPASTAAGVGSKSGGSSSGGGDDNGGNGVLIAAIVGGVIVLGFLAAGIAGWRRSRARRREDRRNRWDAMLGIHDEGTEPAEPGAGEEKQEEATSAGGNGSARDAAAGDVAGAPAEAEAADVAEAEEPGDRTATRTDEQPAVDEPR